MRIILNHEKLSRLHEMVTLLLKQFPSENKAELLLDAIVNKVRLRMRNRLDALNSKNSYSVSLPIEEALAFYLWFEQIETCLTRTDYIFERTVATQIKNQIDQTYGTIKPAGAIDSSLQRTLS
ncbi:MAG: hypothetical protein EOO42_04345 [Flavobacteriales bacterium]|nr:MAG: hypothetical protein EOO42_04345 [Flavobacteriales bacterium]